mgnify:CR=1 FL=1
MSIERLYYVQEPDPAGAAAGRDQVSAQEGAQELLAGQTFLYPKRITV